MFRPHVYFSNIHLEVPFLVLVKSASSPALHLTFPSHLSAEKQELVSASTLRLSFLGCTRLMRRSFSPLPDLHVQ